MKKRHYIIDCITMFAISRVMIWELGEEQFETCTASYYNPLNYPLFSKIYLYFYFKGKKIKRI